MSTATTSIESVSQIRSKTISGATSYMLRTLFLYGIGLVASVILSAYLSVEDFGIYGLVTQIIGLLTFFSDIGLASALIQKKDEPTIAEYRTVFTIQQLLSWAIVGVTVVIAASGVLLPKIGNQGVYVLLALGISFPLASLKTIPSVMLERRLGFSKLVIPQIIEQLLYNGLMIVLAIRGFGVGSYTAAILARSVVGVIVMSAIQWWPIGVALDMRAIRTMLGMGVKFQLNDFLARIKDQLFYLFLGYFLPLREFGYITFAKQWSMMPYQLTVQNVIAITFPTYARLQHDKRLLQRAIEKTLFFITLLIFPMLVGMSVLIIPVVSLIPRYTKWEPALFTFIVFTLSIGWSALSTPLTNTLSAIGNINRTLQLMLLWTILTWVLTPIAIWFFGFHGVALAAMAIACTSFLPILFVREHVRIDVWDQVWRQLTASLIMGAVGVALLPYLRQELLYVPLGAGVMGLMYVCILLAVGREKIFAELSSLRKK